MLLGLIAVASAGHAADNPRKAAAAASAPKRIPILTPAQLRECVKQKSALSTQSDAALKEKATIATEREDVTRSGTELADEMATLDRAEPDQVAAYNEKVADRDKKIDAYQARVTAFNVKADAVNATKDAYVTACENRRYDEQDMNDLKRKK